MSAVYHNALILPAAGGKAEPGEVHEADGKIVYVGAPRPFSGAERVDCGGNLLIPAFANVHAHSAMTLLRGIAEDLPLESWLYDRVFPLEKHVGDEERYWGTKLAQLEYARSGIAVVADMYGDVSDAFRGTGFHLTMLGEENDLFHPADEVLKRAADRYSKYHGGADGRIDYMLGIHAEYTCSDALIFGMADLAAEYGAPVGAHLSETLKEVGECDVRRGMTPAAFFHKAGLFDYGGIAAHAVWCDKDDLLLLADKGVTPAVNCGGNLKLASGFPPVAGMYAAGLAPAIGTDGAAGNNALSAFREMYLFSALQKAVMKDAACVPAVRAFEAATENGCRALGVASGRIAPGNYADMVLVDLSAPCMQPPVDPVSSLVYAADTSVVLMTVAGGKRVYDRGGYSVGEDEEEIRSRVRALVCRLRRKAGV